MRRSIPRVPGTSRWSGARPGTSRGSRRLGHLVGRVDQGQVRKSLREVADEPTRARLVLLGQKAEVIAQRQQALEQRFGIAPTANGQIRIDQPEAAGEEGP